MSYRPRADLHLDKDKWGGQACLLQGKTSSARSEKVVWTEGDTFDLGLWFRKAAGAGQASTAEDVSPAVLVVAGKETAGGALLFFADGFTTEGSGDDLCYVAELNLATTALGTALTSKTSVDVTVDIELQLAGNTSRITYSFVVTVRKQVYQGIEGDPTPATPPYPAPGTIVTTDQVSVPAGLQIHVDAAGKLTVRSV